MPGLVAVVTDSTACIPAQLAQAWGIHVVQQQLRVGDQFDDEARVPGAVILHALRERIAVSTAAPDPAAFFWTYQQAAAQGASAILSVHVSGQLSRTCDAAREAAAKSPVPVHVLDSGTLGMSLGYAALSAARTAQAGADLRQVLGVAATRISRSSELLHVDTLEYLRRGGRIGPTAHLVGTALSVKPLLTLRDGHVAALDRSIGAERALRKLVDRAASTAGDNRIDLAIEHVAGDGRVDGLVRKLRERLPNVREALRVEVSSIVAAHIGPGAIGITVAPTG
jgi:DegV family protein with EDD domain